MQYEEGRRPTNNCSRSQNISSLRCAIQHNYSFPNRDRKACTDCLKGQCYREHQLGDLKRVVQTNLRLCLEIKASFIFFCSIVD